MYNDPISLTKKLISFRSITPIDDGIVDFLIDYLTPHNFICQKLIFEDVTNLYAKYGNQEPNFCFAGHTDIVPVGGNWSIDPFAGTLKDGMLYGRGASDMKAAIAAFMLASIEFTQAYNFTGSISFMITGDEEDKAENGTIKILQYLQEQGQKLDACIIGEPTCPEKLGDMIKYGRRGSISFELTVNGKQGHVAYPHLADNPIDRLIKIFGSLKALKLDDGNEDFIASNLEITDITVGNLVGNNYHLKILSSAEAFLNPKDSPMINALQESIEQITGSNATLSTTGGISDARFIKDHCQVIEFGLVNKTAHHIDEHVTADDIIKLKEIYFRFLETYFGGLRHPRN